MKSNSLYFNFYSGVSGDMLIASLIDLGIDKNELIKFLQKIDKRISIKVKKVLRGLNKCTYIEPVIPSDLNRSFDWAELIKFAEPIKNELYIYKNYIESIELLKKAEEEVHNSHSSKLHELGNFDTIFDIICFYKCIEILKINNLYHSGVPFTQGEIKIDHGIVSSLAPASLNLVKNLQIPVYSSTKNPNFEMCTPTGLCLLKNFKQGKIVSGVIKKIGYGAGSKDFEDSSNSLSANLITSSIDENLNIIETNIDDMSPEFVPFLFDKFLDLGVKDVWYENILMKKGRPAFKISILCSEELVEKVIKIFKSDTSTFGVRVFSVKREAFDRKIETISTKYGEIKIKFKIDSGNIIGAYPEYEDCKNLAKVHNIPLKVIFDQAIDQSKKMPR